MELLSTTPCLRRLAIIAAVVTIPLWSFAAVAQTKQDVVIINWSDLGIWQPYDQGAAPVQAGFGSNGDKHRDVFAEAGDDVARILVQNPSDVELSSLPDKELRERYTREIERLIRGYLNRKDPITKFDLQLVENIGPFGYVTGKPDPGHAKPNRQDLVDRFGKIAYGALSEVVTRMATDKVVTLYGSLGSNGTSMWSRSALAWAPIESHIAAVTLTDGRAKIPDVLEALRILHPAKLRIIVNRRDLWAPSDSIGRLSGAEQVLDAHHAVTLLLADKIKGELGQNHISPLTEAGAEFRITREFADRTRQNLPNMTRRDLFPFIPGHGRQNISGNEAMEGGSHPTGAPPSDGCDAGTRHSCAPLRARRNDPPLPPGRPPPPPGGEPPAGSAPGRFRTEETGPGGINLGSPAGIARSRFPPIEAVVLDPDTHSIILVGHANLSATAGVSGSDFALALWLAFGPNSDQELQFSLDPADPNDPGGKWIRAVYLPETVKGRSAGVTLFQGDLRLKELAFGVGPSAENKIEAWRSTVPGFKSYAELAIDAPGSEQPREQWARFWIVISEAIVKRDGAAVRIDPRMAVKARRQVPGGPTGLRDVETAPDTIEAHWAQLVTRHYDELSKEAPELGRIKQLAAAVLCAKSLKLQQARVDIDQVAKILNADHAPTVETMEALSISWAKNDRIENAKGIQIATRRLHLFGGVDLSASPRFVPGDALVGALGTAALAALRSTVSQQQITTFEYGAELMQATSLPLLERR